MFIYGLNKTKYPAMGIGGYHKNLNFIYIKLLP